MKVFRVTVEEVKTYTTYVVAEDERTALEVPKGDAWFSGDMPEPVIRTPEAAPVLSIYAVPKEWRDELPWGKDPDEKTIRQWLRKSA